MINKNLPGVYSTDPSLIIINERRGNNIVSGWNGELYPLGTTEIDGEQETNQ
jgi:hypothetical protein